MGWVEKRGASYRAALRVPGRTTPLTKTFPTKAAAARWLRITETDIERGDYRPPDRGAVTFTAWSTSWLATRATLRPSARVAEESVVRVHLVPAFGRKRLDEITSLAVATFVSDLTDRRAPSTVRNIYCVLSAVMKDAVREDLLIKNPCTGTRLPRKKRTKPQVFLTEAQVGHLIACTVEYWRALVTTLAGTGLRWGEAVGLRVGSVDILARELHVRAGGCMNEAKGKITFGDPKTEAGLRTIPLTAAVIDVLLPLVAGRASDELVFTSREGQPVRHRNFDYRIWQVACQAAGLMSPRPTPHDLRHTFAAVLISRNVPGGLDTIKVLMGHESIKTTSDTYGYLMPRTHDGVRAALDAAYGGVGDLEPAAVPVPVVAHRDGHDGP